MTGRAVLSWLYVQTLVEYFGDFCICRKRQVQVGAESIASGQVDRKLDLVVGELKRYGTSVVGIQETNWFRKDVWSADGGFTFLHSVDLSSLVVQI